MRGAFVVQLRTTGEGNADQMEGSVEEVDTGVVIRFRSDDELVAFLRERVAELRSAPRMERRK